MDDVSLVTSRQLKMAILRLVADEKRLGEVNKDSTIASSFTPGILENRLGVVFSDEERDKADRAWDELHRRRHLARSYGARVGSSNQKFYRITDSGLRALDTGALDDLDEALRQVDPQFCEMRQAAYDRLESDDEEEARQAAMSLRELLSQVLHRLAPDAPVMSQPWYSKPKDSPRDVTRKQRVRYILQEHRGRASVSDVKSVDSECQFVDAAYGRLSGEEHRHGRVEQRTVQQLARAVETALEILLLGDEDGSVVTLE